MSRLLFTLPTVGAGDTVRIDTASGSNTPADITPAGGGPSINGSTLRADEAGRLPRILGPADSTATLYVKQLTYRGAVTGSPTTVTATDPSSPPPGGPASIQENVNAVAASGAAVTLPDVGTATLHRITLTANCTATLPTPGAGKSFTVVAVQDATGGRTLTFATPSGAIYWPAGSAPTVTAGANKRDVYSFTCADGTNYLGFTAGQDLR